MDCDNIRLVVYRILIILKDLLKIKYYHGRLNISNIHIDNNLNVKLTDYSYPSIIQKDSEFSTEEGSRLDIFCLGICIMKMLGLVPIGKGSDHNIDNYLEDMDGLKKTYTNVSILPDYNSFWYLVVNT